MFGRRLNIRDGFYLEMDDISVEQEGMKVSLRQEPEELYVSEVLQLLKNKSAFLPVYVDRNALAGGPIRRFAARVIFQGKQENVPNRLKRPEKPNVRYPGAFEREQVERDVRAIRSRLESELRDIDSRNDFAERALNGGFFTDEEMMFMGRMDGNDYADSRNYREYRKREKIEKANREISQRRYALEQKERQADAAMERYEKLLAAYEAQERRKNQITLMRCGMTIWQKERLIALLLLRDKNPVWHIYGPDHMDLTHMAGDIYEVESLGEKKPEAGPVLEYMETAYREALPAGFDFKKVREKL